MKLTPPFQLITQGFGENANDSYAAAGLKGHTGIDFGFAGDMYGKPIPATVTALCYSILNKDNPNLNAYRAVYQVFDDKDFSYEISYGHCSAIFAKPGETLALGDVVGYVGNAGTVYRWGKFVTLEEKQAGSHAGSHLHFQVRKLKKVKERSAKKKYLMTENGYYKKGGYYYEIVDYHNGYNGCIDPAQFFEEPQYQFTRDLTVGSVGQDVVELQKRLGVVPTFPIFGPKTRTAVLAYQKAHGIEQTGYCGPLTRASLNA